MSLPTVTFTETDGATGALPAGAKRLAIIGAATAGDLNTPGSYAKTKSITDEFGALGDMVEDAAYAVHTFRRPVVLVRTGATVVGAYGAVDDTAVAGTSAPTADSVLPAVTADVRVEVITGGTIGVAGITYRESLDRGITWSPTKALGTSSTLTVADTGGAGFDLSAGTLIAGDYWTCLFTAPKWNDAEVAAAIAALGASTIEWDGVLISGPITAANHDAIATAMAAFPKKWWIGGLRLRSAGESAATYQASVATAFTADATTFGGYCADTCRVTSPLSSRQYITSPARAVAPLLASVTEDVDIAEISLGSLVGVSLYDAAGNLETGMHDERLNPGLDDARFISLRTHEDTQGIYVTNPRLLSAAGSDYEFFQHRRVINLAKASLTPFFLFRLSKAIRVYRSTGFIREEDALDIESGANAILRGVLGAKPKASDWNVELSRTDNLLSTKTLTGTVGVVPLAYPKFINFGIGFYNPALRTVEV